jgi:hypothetical protein
MGKRWAIKSGEFFIIWKESFSAELSIKERRREDLNLRNPLGVNLISSEAH